MQPHSQEAAWFQPHHNSSPTSTFSVTTQYPLGQFQNPQIMAILLPLKISCGSQHPPPVTAVGLLS